MAMKQVRDIAHLRQIVAKSFELKTYEPKSSGDWDAAAARRTKLA